MSRKPMENKAEHFLNTFFYPKSVAIMGASNNPMRINYHLVANLVNLGFQGKIYPVHPEEREIIGLRAYPSVKQIDEIVDLAVIGVSQALTLGVLKECIEKGIRELRCEPMSYLFLGGIRSSPSTSSRSSHHFSSGSGFP
jgi:predicted CoA-binding protein